MSTQGQTWKRFIVELYDERGYRCCWEPEGKSGRTYDEADLRRFISEAVRGILKLEHAQLRFAVDGDDMIVGAFVGDVDPPNTPRRGVLYVPSFAGEL